jgi:hypothetical protein
LRLVTGSQSLILYPPLIEHFVKSSNQNSRLIIPPQAQTLQPMDSESPKYDLDDTYFLDILILLVSSSISLFKASCGSWPYVERL